MTTEPITCRACGTKNTPQMPTCLKCGASISTHKESKTAEKPTFSESLLPWTTSFLEKRSVTSQTSKAYKYVVAAGSILSAGSVVFTSVKERLRDRELKAEWFLLFNAEVACYVQQEKGVRELFS
jgi:hypothetical protein